MRSGYSRLGDSASQVCAPSLKGAPRASYGARVAPSSGGGASGRASAASGVARGAAARIAALERELAEARQQTTQLEGQLRRMTTGARGSN